MSKKNSSNTFSLDALQCLYLYLYVGSFHFYFVLRENCMMQVNQTEDNSITKVVFFPKDWTPWTVEVDTSQYFSELKSFLCINICLIWLQTSKVVFFSYQPEMQTLVSE